MRVIRREVYVLAGGVVLAAILCLLCARAQGWNG